MIVELSPESVDPDPIAQLVRWIADVSTAGDEAAAMALATATALGRPAVRFVLLRGVDARGLRFFTSYFSRKGRQLEENPFAAAALYWHALGRQVLVEGSVRALDDAESDAYFNARPRGHQIAAWASEQSEPVSSRDVLDDRYAHFEARFEGESIPRPHSWGGYVIAPVRLEFWQQRPNRMHDRIEYRRDGNLWRVRRLQP